MSDFQNRNRPASDDAIAVVMSHGEQFDDSGLAFWQDKHRQYAFTILAPLALDLVAVVASQAYLESVFSLVFCTGKCKRMSTNLNRVFFCKCIAVMLIADMQNSLSLYVCFLSEDTVF